MGNERKKINLTDIDENSIVASFKEGDGDWLSDHLA